MNYEDVLLDHNRRPRNRGDLADATHAAEERNPRCGDQVRLQLQVNASGGITAVRFTSQACAICSASASLLTTRVVSLSTAQALQLSRTVRAALASSPDSNLPEVFDGELEALSGVRRFPVRVACAQLPWQALEKSLGSSPAPAADPSTERGQ